MKTALDVFINVFGQQITDVESQIDSAETDEQKEMLIEGLEELLKMQLKLEQLLLHRKLEHCEPKTN